MEVRRRTAETVRQTYDRDAEVFSSTFASEDAEEPTCYEEDDTLVRDMLERGKGLMDKAKGSDFHEVDSLVQSINCFVAAAAKGSHNASERLKQFGDARYREVIQRLPDELQEIMHVFADGSEAEQSAFRVACELFDVMAGSEPDSIIPKDKLNEAAQKLMMREVEVVGASAAKSADDFRRSVNKLLFIALVRSENGPVVTRESFCYVACKYARGELPLSLVGDTDTQLTPEQMAMFKKANLFKKITDYPIQTMQSVTSSIYRYIEKHGVRWVWSFLSLKQFYIFLFVYLIPKINVSLIVSTLATAVFFASFLVMCIATLQVMAHSKKADSIIGTSHVFQNFLINTKTMERRLIRQLAVPYLSFLGALLLAMLSIGGAYQQLIYYSLLAVVAGGMAFAVFYTFSCWRSPLVLLSIMTRLPGWFMVFLYLISTWLPIPEFLFFFGKQIVAIPVLPGVYLDFNLTTLVQVPLQLILLVWFLYQQSWHNFYMGIGPYVLFISWWIFCRDLVSHGSLLNLIMLIPGALFFFTFIPFLIALIPISPLFVYAYYGLSWQFMVSVFGLVAGGLAAWKVVTNFKWMKETQWLNIPFKFLLLFQLVVLVPILLVATVSYTRSFAPSKFPLVSVEEYTKYCGPQLWEDSGNSIQTQLNCFHLKGRLLQASAQVESVKITQVTNNNDAGLLKLPASVRLSLTCLMGETKPMCGNADNMTTCVYKGCHFDSSNTYVVQVKASLQLTDGTLFYSRMLPIILIAHTSHYQLNNSALVRLGKGTEVQFNATFEDGMGSELPSLRLHSLTSPSGNYSSALDIDIEKAGRTIMTEFWDGVQRMTNFILEITFGYAPSEYYKPKQ